jgi:hypothetical protein
MKILDAACTFPLNVLLEVMTGLLTVRVSPVNRATAQPRNSAGYRFAVNRLPSVAAGQSALWKYKPFICNPMPASANGAMS